jgi:hypothetical protein
VTAPNVEPVITVAQLDALAARLGCQGQADFAERLGISQSHMSNIYAGRRQILAGPLHLLLADKLRRHHLL